MLIHLFINGHLGYFHILAIVNIVAMNKYLFETLLSIISGIYPEVELLNYMIILFLTFCGTPILFSTAAAPFYIPTNSVEEFQHSG